MEEGKVCPEAGCPATALLPHKGKQYLSLCSVIPSACEFLPIISVRTLTRTWLYLAGMMLQGMCLYLFLFSYKPGFSMSAVLNTLGHGIIFMMPNLRVSTGSSFSFPQIQLLSEALLPW